MAKTKTIKITASRLIGSFLDFFRYNPVHDDKHKNGDNQLEQNGSNREFCAYFEPAFWIGRVTLPKPPDYHSDELNGQKDIDNDLEPFPRLEL
jgi:hypothetical protein